LKVGFGFRRWHLCNGFDFTWIGLDTFRRHRVAKECQGCRAKYALVRVKFQSTGANLGENVSEARVVFLLGRPPHDNIVLRVGASWEVCNNGGYFCLKHFTSGMYSERQAFKPVSSEGGTKGEKIGTFIVYLDLPISRRGIHLREILSTSHFREDFFGCG
jgi:hypothetical protein